MFREDCSTCLSNIGYTPHDESVKRKGDKEGRTEGGSDNDRIIGGGRATSHSGGTGTKSTGISDP